MRRAASRNDGTGVRSPRHQFPSAYRRRGEYQKPSNRSTIASREPRPANRSKRGGHPKANAKTSQAGGDPGFGMVGPEPTSAQRRRTEVTASTYNNGQSGGESARTRNGGWTKLARDDRENRVREAADRLRARRTSAMAEARRRRSAPGQRHTGARALTDHPRTPMTQRYAGRRQGGVTGVISWSSHDGKSPAIHCRAH